jgi:hypothetical protein
VRIAKVRTYPLTAPSGDLQRTSHGEALSRYAPKACAELVRNRFARSLPLPEAPGLGIGLDMAEVERWTGRYRRGRGAARGLMERQGRTA